MHHTHSHLLSCRFTGIYHFRFTRFSIIAILIAIILSVNPINSLNFVFTAYSTAATDYISDILKVKTDIKRYTIATVHDELTIAAPLKCGIIYDDYFKKTGINYYYINNLSKKDTLYIKCLTGKFKTSDIQIFDDTNRELDIKLCKKSTYLYITMKKIISKLSDNSRIYIAIGGKKNTKLQIACLSCYEASYKKTQKERATEKTTQTHKPAATKKVTQTHKPAATKKVTQTHKPATTKKVTQTHKPAATKKVTQTHKPAVTKKATHHNSNKNKTDLFFVSLSHKFLSLKKRECIKLRYYIKPSTIKPIKIFWSSTNNNIVSVSNGKIITHTPGIAIIKLTIKHNNITKSTTCTIRVKNS